MLAGALCGLRPVMSRTRLRRNPATSSTSSDAPKDGSQPVPVWVLNLDRSVDRWETMQKQLASQGVSGERFPATLGKAVPKEELMEKATFGARWFCTPGMIGCFMSHQRMWARVVEENLPYVAILEDDAVLYPDFNKKIQVLLDELPEDWDVCLLGAVGCVGTEQEAPNMKLYGTLTGGTRKSPGKTRLISDNLYIPYKPAGTHAYMVSTRGAKKMLERLPRARYHVDLTAWSLQDLKLYAAKDFLATQAFDDDTTVSKTGEPLTKRFLAWCLECTGLATMSRRSGIPNLTWAWKTALFAVPVPFGSGRFIIECGPAASVWVLIMLSSIPFRSFIPIGIGIGYMGLFATIIRCMAGTFKARLLLFFVIATGGLIYLG